MSNTTGLQKLLGATALPQDVKSNLLGAANCPITLGAIANTSTAIQGEISNSILKSKEKVTEATSQIINIFSGFTTGMVILLLIFVLVFLVLCRLISWKTALITFIAGLALFYLLGVLYRESLKTYIINNFDAGVNQLVQGLKSTNFTPIVNSFLMSMKNSGCTAVNI